MIFYGLNITNNVIKSSLIYMINNLLPFLKKNILYLQWQDKIDNIIEEVLYETKTKKN